MNDSKMVTVPCYVLYPTDGTLCEPMHVVRRHQSIALSL